MKHFLSKTSDPSRIISFITQHPFSYTLKPKNILAIYSSLEMLHAEREEYIFRQGEQVDDLYIIFKGKISVKAYDDNEEEVFMNSKENGAFLGEHTVISSHKSKYSAMAIEDSVLLRLNGIFVRESISEFPDLYKKLVNLTKLADTQLNFYKTYGTGELKKKLDVSYFSTEPSLPHLLNKLNDAAGGNKQLAYCKSVAFLARELTKILCPVLDTVLYWAGLLHEIGKISLDSSTIEKIQKNLPLTDEEEQELAQIYNNTLAIIYPDHSLYEQMKFIRFLNESDYRQMPMEAQILSVAADFVSLMLRNPSIEQAIDRLEARETKYNPVIIATLREFFNKYNVLQINNFVNTLKMMNSALGVKDGITVRHCDDVARLAVMLGKKIRLSRSELEELRLGAEIHNIGMLLVPYELLNAPRILTPKEYEVIKQHPVHSANFLEHMPSMGNIALFIRHHHENFDGTGYPQKLSGEQIPLFSRIIKIADCYCALTSSRRYRKSSKPYSTSMAFTMMGQQMAHEFDPELMSHFRNMRKNEEIKNFEAERNRAEEANSQTGENTGL